MIPELIIDQVNDRIDIVEVISQYVSLKRAGRNFKACCPFHAEKTPSFMVNPDKGIFHCFGCGVGGNAFTFLMKYEGMEFPEAVRWCAEKVGITIPQQGSSGATERYQRLYQLNTLAVTFYKAHLQKGPDKTKLQAYLKKRTITTQTIDDFALGWAPQGWDQLLKYAQKKGFTQQELLQTGLIITKDERTSYDRFRRRLMFPIIDLRGRCCAFGGRVLDDTQPKYMNSPETALYSKGRQLYGFNKSKEAIRSVRQAIIVEGYMDLIRVYQNGIHNVVASLGTALTQDQTRLLRRYADEVIVIYDADQAGQDATMRGIDRLLEEHCSVKIVTLPEGDDPDSFIQQHGVEALRHKIKQAETIIDYLLGRVSKIYDVTKPEGIAQACQVVLSRIIKIGDAVLQSMYLSKVSAYFGINEEALRTELGKLRTGSPRKQLITNSSLKTGADHSDSRWRAESMLVAFMLEGSDFIEGVKAHLTLDDFKDRDARRLVEVIFEHYEQGTSIDAAQLVNYTAQENISRRIAEAVCGLEGLDDKTKAFVDCLRYIKRAHLEQRLQYIQQELHTAQGCKDDDRVTDLVGQHTQLVKELQLFK